MLEMDTLSSHSLKHSPIKLVASMYFPMLESWESSFIVLIVSYRNLCYFCPRKFHVKIVHVKKCELRHLSKEARGIRQELGL